MDFDLGGLVETDLTFNFQVNTGTEESKGVDPLTIAIGMSGSMSMFDFFHMKGDFMLRMSATKFRVNVATGFPINLSTVVPCRSSSRWWMHLLRWTALRSTNN